MWFNFAHLFSVSLLPLSTALDGGKPACASTGQLLRGGLLLCERDLHLVILETDRTSRRRSLARPQEHAVPFNRDSVSFRDCIDRGAKVSLRWFWNLLLLPHRLFAASRARDRATTRHLNGSAQTGRSKGSGNEASGVAS
jgi:hypothetical protein